MERQLKVKFKNTIVCLSCGKEIREFKVKWTCQVLRVCTDKDLRIVRCYNSPHCIIAATQNIYPQAETWFFTLAANHYHQLLKEQLQIWGRKLGCVSSYPLVARFVFDFLAGPYHPPIPTVQNYFQGKSKRDMHIWQDFWHFMFR